MGKSLRLSETWFRRGLWLVAAIFAFFLINLGGTVVNDLPKVEKPLELADFLDKKTSQALNGNLKTHEQTISAANAALEQAELQLETAQKNTQAAQATFNNWLATRQATQQASQDQELVARTKALDALKDKERLASSAIEKQNQIILDANQSYDKTRRALDELESVAQTQLNKEYRSNFFNKSLNQELVDKIAKSKNFERFLRYVIYDKSLVNLQKSLLTIENNPQMNSENLFSLGINAVNNNNLNIALKFFNEANQKSYLRTYKDKSLFWIYLLTQNQLYLEELALSWDNNIYSLYAKELLNLQIDNIEYSIPLKNTKSSFNIYDPFEWIKVLDDTKKNFDEQKLQKYENLFSDENTLVHHAFILERFTKYKKQYFITPYRNIVKNYDVDKQVLIYSIARQESHFIPSSISFSSAQGVMQIMPFLSSNIAKKLNENYNVYEQFIPNINIRYGSYHLDDLMKQFNNNPLFMAYAYNGGAGYTKTQLKKGLFAKKNRFEPFLSMELISFAETREYGKKVLANYYIYNNYLNSENRINLSTIFQNLIEPY